MITIIYGEPRGFREEEFENEFLALETLMKLNLSEKDIFIDHRQIENGNLDILLIKDAINIMVQDKLIGA